MAKPYQRQKTPDGKPSGPYWLSYSLNGKRTRVSLQTDDPIEAEARARELQRAVWKQDAFGRLAEVARVQPETAPPIDASKGIKALALLAPIIQEHLSKSRPAGAAASAERDPPWRRFTLFVTLAGLGKAETNQALASRAGLCETVTSRHLSALRSMGLVHGPLMRNRTVSNGLTQKGREVADLIGGAYVGLLAQA